jgi:DNA-binding NarL/FixJ family response regulator
MVKQLLLPGGFPPGTSNAVFPLPAASNWAFDAMNSLSVWANGKGDAMLRIVLATSRQEACHSFSAALSSDPEVHLDHVASGAAALETVRTSSPDLVVIDSPLPDFKALSLVQDLLMVNAMVNTAVVSSLTDQEFHEASEGLGVLARLPATPDKSDATELLRILRKVLGRTA